MAIKMIVTDLDGTLVDRQFAISAGNAAAVQAARKRGIIVAAATGRMYKSAMKYVEQLGLKAPVIAYNGALIKEPGENGRVIFDCTLDPAVARAALQFAFDNDIYIQLYTADNLYFSELTEAARRYQEQTGIKGAAVGRDGLLSRSATDTKLLMVTEREDQVQNTMARLKARFGDKLTVMQSAPRYIELVSPGVSKAAAAAKLAAHYGIGRAEIMALGDAGNDTDMLRYAGIGVAMGDAADEVKAAADYVADNVENDGWAKAVTRFALR